MLTPKETRELKVVEDLMALQRSLVREITETLSRYFEVCKTKGFQPSWVANEIQEAILKREVKIDLKLAEFKNIKNGNENGQMRLRP
jgi:hypothetical protein